MVYFQLLLPLLLVVPAVFLFPVRLERFMEEDDLANFDDRLEPMSGSDFVRVQLPFLVLTVLWVGLIKMIYGAMYPPLVELADGVLFETRFLHSHAAHLLFALFPAIILGALTNYHFCLFRGKDFMQSIMFKYEKIGESIKFMQIPLCKQARLLKPIGLVVAILVTVLNCMAYFSFLQVTTDKVRGRTFFGTQVIDQSITNIVKASIYRLRKVPNGQIKEKPHLVMDFADGSFLDTFYLVEKEELGQLKSALQKASGGDLEVGTEELRGN